MNEESATGPLMGPSGRVPNFEPAELNALQASLRGRLIGPADTAYEERRHVWNGMIEKRPALIVECVGVADVIAAMRFVRASGLPVAVRCGGHNVGGTAMVNAGLVIDLSRMRAVRVDPVRRTARVEGGATLGCVDREAQAFGLAVPAGVMSRTGIGGLTLHGGLGFLSRHFGLTCDNLIGADVVTADGRLVTASETENADLLWALRGGGGNFGVVTSFEFKLHPVGPEVWMGLTMYPAADAPRLLAHFRDVMATALDELMAVAIFWNTPHDESLPPAARNQPTLVLASCWSGPMEQGEAAIRPLREAGTPLVDMSAPMPFVEVQKLFDPEYPDGRRYYWKSIYLNDLSQDTIAILTALGASRPSPISSVDIWALGGAIGRTPAGHGAFAKRQAPFLLGIEANWDSPAGDEANIAWARRGFSEMERRFPDAGAYLNFPGFGEEGEALLRRSYDGNYARLQAIKAQYDPDNVFRSNLNIAPHHPLAA
jgi:FAD/FMN-containing dehydrogenase